MRQPHKMTIPELREQLKICAEVEEIFGNASWSAVYREAADRLRYQEEIMSNQHECLYMLSRERNWDGMEWCAPLITQKPWEMAADAMDWEPGEEVKT